MRPSESASARARMTVGADTNVLVRLLVSDDLQQQAAVVARLERLLAQGDSILVSPVVLAEVSWVLSSAYGYDRQAIGAAVRGLLETPPFVILHDVQVAQALDWFAEGPADFADYLILALATAAGAESLLTFDQRLLKHELCEHPAG